MQTYQGSCHCGAVRFQIEADLETLTQCNCSICSKKGALLLRVPPERFTLLSGQADLREYRFNTKVAQHFFCQHCGIHPFSHPRAAPELYTINARCLDGEDLHLDQVPIRRFDGQNWEQAVAALKQS